MECRKVLFSKGLTGFRVGFALGLLGLGVFKTKIEAIQPGHGEGSYDALVTHRSRLWGPRDTNVPSSCLVCIVAVANHKESNSDG